MDTQPSTPRQLALAAYERAEAERVAATERQRQTVLARNKREWTEAALRLMSLVAGLFSEVPHITAGAYSDPPGVGIGDDIYQLDPPDEEYLTKPSITIDGMTFKWCYFDGRTGDAGRSSSGLGVAFPSDPSGYWRASSLERVGHLLRQSETERNDDPDPVEKAEAISREMQP